MFYLREKSQIFLKKIFYFAAKPDFIIIGTQKGGTRFLQEYLEAHANVRIARALSFKRGKWKLRNEMHFFDRNFEKGLEWYLSHFMISPRDYYQKRQGKIICFGEKTPNYLCLPWLSEYLIHTFPRIKIIILLRNPVTRTYSEYRMRVRKQKETHSSFEDAIESAMVEIENGKYLWDNNIIARSLYIEQVKLFQNHFPAEQLCIIKSEDMFQSSQLVYKNVLHFLDLPLWIPQSFVNRKEKPYIPMQAKTKKMLYNFFEPYNRKLYELLGRDFNWKEEL